MSFMTNQLTPVRTLHLIDIENLCEGVVNLGSVTAARDAYASVSPIEPGDHTIIASSKANCIQTVAWGTARRVVGTGIDGADLALLDVLATEPVIGFYGRVTIASGDGIFADVIGQLGFTLRTRVVSRVASCSRRLRLASHEFAPLPSFAAVGWGVA